MNASHPDYIVAESTPTLRAYFKDETGKALSLSGATVTLTFRKPDNTTFTRTATISSASEGIAVYQAVTTDFPPADVGVWQVQWTVTKGTQVYRTKPQSFHLEVKL